jgi:hypothetical protein
MIALGKATCYGSEMGNMICTFDWSAVQWQPLATLATGFMAAGAAWFIARRQLQITRFQAEISERAAEIAAGQARTAELARRAALFDRRFEVYSVVQHYLSFSLAPKRTDEFTLPPQEVFDRLRTALSQARFLFPLTVRLAIDAAFELADMLDTFSASATSDEDRDKARLLRKELRSKLNTLADEFGDEMRLYAESAAKSEDEA